MFLFYIRYSLTVKVLEFHLPLPVHLSPWSSSGVTNLQHGWHGQPLGVALNRLERGQTARWQIIREKKAEQYVFQGA